MVCTFVLTQRTGACKRIATSSNAELKTKLANLERGIESDEEPEPDQPPPSEWNNYGPFNIATLKDGSNCIVS